MTSPSRISTLRLRNTGGSSGRSEESCGQYFAERGRRRGRRKERRRTAHYDIVKLDLALRRPLLRRTVLLDDGGSLLREVVGVVQDALDRVEVVLDLGSLTDHPGEGGGDGEDVRQDQTGLRRVDRRPATRKKG